MNTRINSHANSNGGGAFLQLDTGMKWCRRNKRRDLFQNVAHCYEIPISLGFSCVYILHQAGIEPVRDRQKIKVLRQESI